MDLFAGALVMPMFSTAVARFNPVADPGCRTTKEEGITEVTKQLPPPELTWPVVVDPEGTQSVPE